MTWRVHRSRDKKGDLKEGSWDWCQLQTCSEAHFIANPFHGVRPAVDAWEGVKHPKKGIQ